MKPSAADSLRWGAADALGIAGAWPSERDDVFTSTWSSRRAGWTRRAVMLALS